MTRARWAIAAWIAVLVLCIVQAARTSYVADLSSFLPTAPTAEQRLLVEQLREGALSRTMMVGIQGGDASARARTSKALAARLRADGRFSLVANGAAGGFEREREFLFAHRYQLSPSVNEDRFTVNGLRDAVRGTLDLLSGSAGLATKAMVPRDPTGEILEVLEAIQPPGGPTTAEGAWASADRQRAVLIARTKANGSDIDAQVQAVAAVRAAFEQAMADAKAAGLKLLVSGPGVFAAQSRSMIEHDVTRLSALSAIIVFALLFAAYRSGRALVLGLVPVVTGALAGIAAVSLGFGSVHGITLGFGITLIGEAVDYAIYLFVQSPNSRLWPTIRLGVLTSIAGFCALVFSGLPGLAQLGVYSIVGIVAAALATRYVLPQMLPRDFAVRDLSPVGARFLAATRVLRRARWGVALLAVAAAVFLAGKRDTLWDRDIASLNPIGEAERKVDAQLRADLGASDARVMAAVQGPTAEDALGAAERAGLALQPLVSQGQLAGLDNPARLLPPVQIQLARAASLPEAGVLRSRLQEALAGMPLNPSRLEPFIEDVQRARSVPPVTRESIAGTALESALEGMLFRGRDGTWTALIGLRPAADSPIDVAAVRDALARGRVEHAAVLDLKAEVDRLYSGYFARALAASIAGFGAIVALLFIALRRPTRVLWVLAPLAAGVLVVAALHALMGTKLTLIHLVGLLLVVAVGSNYALFFDRLAAEPGEGAPRTLASLALADLTAVASFGVLALSSIPVLSAIGSTVALGAFLTLLFSAATSRRGIISP